MRAASGNGVMETNQYFSYPSTWAYAHLVVSNKASRINKYDDTRPRIGIECVVASPVAIYDRQQIRYAVARFTGSQATFYGVTCKQRQGPAAG